MQLMKVCVRAAVSCYFNWICCYGSLVQWHFGSFSIQTLSPLSSFTFIPFHWILILMDLSSPHPHTLTPHPIPLPHLLSPGYSHFCLLRSEERHDAPNVEEVLPALLQDEGWLLLTVYKEIGMETLCYGAKCTVYTSVCSKICTMLYVCA